MLLFVVSTIYKPRPRWYLNGTNEAKRDPSNYDLKHMELERLSSLKPDYQHYVETPAGGKAITMWDRSHVDWRAPVFPRGFTAKPFAGPVKWEYSWG